MRRILFTCFGFNIYSYPAMLYLGLVAGVLVGAQIAQRSGIDPDRFALASVILLIPAILGARLLYVLMHWDIYAGDPRRIWRRGEGGMAMYGGFIMIVAFSVPLLPAMGLPFLTYWDAAIFTTLAGMTVARVGCLLNGCCSGRPTESWCGVNLPDHRGVWRKRIPSQIIEIMWTAALLVVLLNARTRMPFAGATVCLGVAGYAGGRFIVQRLREDHAGDVVALQRISGVLAIAAIAALIALFVLR